MMMMMMLMMMTMSRRGDETTMTSIVVRCFSAARSRLRLNKTDDHSDQTITFMLLIFMILISMIAR